MSELHNIKKGIFSFLEGRSLVFLAGLTLLLIFVIGVIDNMTGYELHFFLFYLIPVAIGAWYGTRNMGIFISILSTVSWLLAEIFTGHDYSHIIYVYWNAFIRLIVFLIVAELLSGLRQKNENLQRLARTDSLTGAANVKYFKELLATEIYRSRRNGKPFTMVFFDLDNFKNINDTMGHSAGDNILITVTEQAKSNLRIIDIIGRLGGDEFGIILPEANSEAARLVVHKLQKWLLDQMKINNWPITFSIGAVTYNENAPSPDEVIREADRLMYEAKSSGKNSCLFKCL